MPISFFFDETFSALVNSGPKFDPSLSMMRESSELVQAFHSINDPLTRRELVKLLKAVAAGVKSGMIGRP